MSFWKIFVGIMGMAVFFSLVVYWMTSNVAQPPDTGAMGEWDMTVPRAPAEAKSVKNPIEPTPQVIAQGKKLYLGKGNCYICHGNEGKGDGESGTLLNPPPRDFTDPRFQRLRTDGDLYWVIVHGSSGTGMFSYAPRIISEEEAWMVVHYLRTLAKEEQQ
jgi:mono/diheme cytochrome c family protein